MQNAAQHSFPNHIRATHILNIYRSAMRKRITRAYDDAGRTTWLDDLQTTLPMHIQDDLEKSRDKLELEITQGKRPKRMSDSERYAQLIDIPIFKYAVEDGLLFGALSVEPAQTNMANAYHIRNEWAHPPQEDMPQSGR